MIVSRTLLLILLLCPSSALPQARFCGIQWETAIRISGDSVLPLGPEIALNGDTVHIAWFGLDTLGTVANAGIQYSHSFDGGRHFSRETTLVPAGNALLPGLMSCAGPFLSIVFAAAIDTFYGAAILRSSDNGVSWVQPLFIRQRALPRLLTSIGSSLFVHFEDLQTGRFGLLLSNDHGANWALQSTNTPPLDVAASTPGRLHALSVLTSTTTREIGYYFSPNAGVTWIGPDILSREDTTSSSLPSLAVNERGDLFAAWNDGGSIEARSSRSNGSSWTPEIGVSGGRNAVFADLAASDEFVAAIWDNDFGGFGGIGLKVSNDYGVRYCPEDAPTPGTAVGEPAVKIFNNLLHAVWSEKIDGDQEILYRKGVLMENPDFAPGPPNEFALKQNFPNPFNDATRIAYDLAQESHVTLILYTIQGQEVGRLVDGVQPPQRYSLMFEAAPYPTGVYFYRLRTESFTETRKMMIAR